MRPQISYIECIIIQPSQVGNFTWSGLSGGCPSEIIPILMLDGRFAIPADVSRMPDLPQNLMDWLIIARGVMNTGSNEVIPKYYSDTVILNCCDFTNHNGVH